jgi:geranylgeranylglycerol-phosphate geranylgeranyltransferase
LRYLTALFLLPRPLNGLVTALSVGVGALTSGQSLSWVLVLLAALSAALINGAGNAFNDLIDIDIDRINRPGRPLPSGRLSPLVAGVQSLLLTLVGCLLAFWLSPWHGLAALGVGALLIIYSIFLKNSLLWGNILIGCLGAIAFPYGALAVGDIGRSWIPALFALLFHIGREIVKDIEDVTGDRLRGEHTLPLRWGRAKAAVLAAFIYLSFVVFTWIPYLNDLYGLAYLMTVLPVDLLVLHVLWQLYRQRAELADERLGRQLKIGMLIGLIAIVIGELGFVLI